MLFDWWDLDRLRHHRQLTREHNAQDAVTFVEERLARGETPEAIAAAMLDHCLAGDPKDACGIGCDNMTALIVMLKPDEAS
jgi:protein phosphatase 1G